MTIATGYLVLGIWATVAPANFTTILANFGEFNPHLVRDFGVCALSFGSALMIAAFKPAWRRPALLITALWSSLHALNHWVDAAEADPAWIGWAEASLLTIVALVLAGLARAEHSSSETGSDSRSA
ncbi:hypothetical protein [Mycolicibacterium sp. YH-1]|uniref:hypothetical protein n=1 Tax=Mycolicibacterium sp. YH-1 TaxID=2908837 RepID=UPI001F4C291D|nr:hypothetical protein [Mycolicibacterium sp. YH-1]UNB53213.1 hypothetical protein L0M16_02220 [Mycolicibacterium sp. YH-1]